MPGTAGKIVTDKDNGKREVRNASGKLAVFNAAGDCDCCSPITFSYWKFQQLNFNGFSSLTEYSYGSFPSGFAWQVLDAGPLRYRAKLPFDNDSNCDGINSHTQSAHMILELVLHRAMTLTLYITGQDEDVPSGPYTSWDYNGNRGTGYSNPPGYCGYRHNEESGYSMFVHCPGITRTPDDRFDNFGNPNAARCGEMGAVTSEDTPSPQTFSLAPGTHRFKFYLSTGDELFHHGAHYVCDMQFV